MTYKAEQGLVGKELFEGIYKVEEVVALAKDFRHLDHTLKDSISQKVAYLKEEIDFADVDEVLKNIPRIHLSCQRGSQSPRCTQCYFCKLFIWGCVI
ncbi:MAG: hypothetical protein Q9M36_13585 [Sulfurovum sp.]|nr:hypothetical protein [Sulfurovum sp.]